MELLKLVASLSLDTKDYVSGIGSAIGSGANWANTFKDVGSSVVNVSKTIAGGISATASKIGELATESAKAGDRIDKMSQKLGVSREAFQEWDYILSQNGASVDSLGTGMKTLQNALGGISEDGSSASQTFLELGLNLDDLKSMNPEEAFDSTVKALQQMPPGVEKTNAAMKLFGKQGQELLPLLNQTSESTDELRARAHELGLVLGDDAVDSAVGFTDAMDTFKRTISAVSSNVGAELLPAFSEGLTAVTNFIAGVEGADEELDESLVSMIEKLGETAVKFIEKGTDILLSLTKGVISAIPSLVSAVITIVPTIVQTILEMLPEVLKMGIELLVELANGFASMIVTFIPLALDTIITLADTLLDNLDILIEASLEIILALANGLIDYLPKLIEKIPYLIDKILDAIINNLPTIIKGAIEIIFALANGLVNSIPTLLQAIPKVIGSIINYIKDTDWIGIGLDIVRGIASGLLNSASVIWEAVKSVGNNIVGGFKNFFGIKSPSVLMKQIIGFDLGTGISFGIVDGVEDSINSVQKSIAGIFDDSLNSNALGIYELANNDFIGGSRLSNQTITTNVVLDGEIVATSVNAVNEKKDLQYQFA